jgi:coproporphyrinogen III oxidase-like Fe-S oxidoreductase
MIVERILTEYLKRKNQQTLRLERFDNIQPPEPAQGKEYLAYIHIPFCEELCPYCSFNRIPLEEGLAAQYFNALKQELRMYADLGFRVTSVYVGGGTPTVIPAETVSLLAELRDLFDVKEISLETNPNHLRDDILQVLREGGVNRLSVGVQSFDDSLLKSMERYHKYGSGEQIAQRLTDVQGLFDTLNIDMIFNFPTQTCDMLDRDLQIIQEIGSDQVTFYPLMVSDITRKELARRFGPIGYAQEKRFYKRIFHALKDTHPSGTAWCFSRRESMIDEYVVDYDEYLGLGSGSFGYLNGEVLANTFSIPDYIEAVQGGRFPLFGKKRFSVRDRMGYDLMMKLFGGSINLEQIDDKYNGELSRVMSKEIAVLKLLGGITEKDRVLRLTDKGRYYWVIMMREFFTGVNSFRDICLGRG